MPEASPFVLAQVLVWGGVMLLGGLMVHRWRRGAWSLEDAEVPPAGLGQKAVVIAAVLATLAGLGLFIQSWLDRGLG